MPETDANLYKRMLDDRVILIEGVVDEVMANTVVAHLLFFQKENPNLPVNMLIDSPGGEMNPSLAITDTMRYVKTPIRSHCSRRAEGSAVLFLAQGRQGMRSIGIDGKLRFFPLWVDESASNTGTQTSDSLLLLECEMAQRLEECTRRHAEFWRAQMQMEASINSSEALELGLVDEIKER